MTTDVITIEDLLRKITIDRSDDETMVDLYLAEKDESDFFINNIKHILVEEDWSILKTEILSDAELNSFLVTESGHEFVKAVCEAAYCTWEGIVVNEDTRVCEPVYRYYLHWNGTGVDSEYECDIDLG